MSDPSNDHAAPERCRDIVLTGYESYRNRFDIITQRAAQRFMQRDWPAMRSDTVERLDLYEKMVGQTQTRIEAALAPEAMTRQVWKQAKTLYGRATGHQPDADIRQTFYNSVTRRLLKTVGFDSDLEFSMSRADTPSQDQETSFTIIRYVNEITPDTLRGVFEDYSFSNAFDDLNEDIRLCANRITKRLARCSSFSRPFRLEMVAAPFYRDTRAYLIGRLHDGKALIMPLVFAVGNADDGLFTDTLLLTQDHVRVLFSFTRAYFHVAVQAPGPLVRFLKTLMPGKRTAELYTILGFHKHGKTALYQDLLHHQQVCGQDRFDIAQGQRGMVMIAFNMPSDDLIYKLIRDRFASPKRTTHQQVMEKYDYVFKHDRAGRLMDVQTFENLKIEQCCFSGPLLDEIKARAAKAASFEEPFVMLHHVYVERRVTPLDLFLNSAAAEEAEAAVIDFGQTIKDLARVNIFPGDMLLKNFGVTRLGRVVFYDYDELCPLTACNFRWLPTPRHEEDIMAAEPWFTVDANDVFPEEFKVFLGLAPRLKQIFFDHHGDLLTPDFWQQTQAKILKGQWTSILPYAESERLRPFHGQDTEDNRRARNGRARQSP